MTIKLKPYSPDQKSRACSRRSPNARNIEHRMIYYFYTQHSSKHRRRAFCGESTAESLIVIALAGLSSWPCQTPCAMAVPSQFLCPMRLGSYNGNVPELPSIWVSEHAGGVIRLANLEVLMAFERKKGNKLETMETTYGCELNWLVSIRARDHKRSK